MRGKINKRREKKRIRRALVRHELARRSFVDFLALANGPDWIPTRFSTFIARNRRLLESCKIIRHGMPMA